VFFSKNRLFSSESYKGSTTLLVRWRRLNRSNPLVFVLVFLTASCAVTVLPVGASEDAWSTMAPMPTARMLLGVGVVNGKIYAIGGTADSYGPYVSANEEYDPMTNSWTTKKPMPTATIGFGVAVYQNKIYAIGGLVFGNVGAIRTGATYVYDPATDSWENKTSMPTPIAYANAHTVNGKIYVIGGGINLTQVYDPTTDSWTTKKPMPQAYPYNYQVSAVVDNKIFVIDEDKLNQIYDTQNDSWSYGKPIPTPVNQGAAAGATTGIWAPKRIYFIGGTHEAILALNQVYDPEKDSWSIGTSMPTTRSGLAIAVVNDTLFAIGGTPLPITEQTYAKNEQYIPTSDTVSPLPSPSASPTPTSSATPSTPATTTPNPSTSPLPSISPNPSSTPSPTPSPSPSLSPSPSIPEFPTWIVLPLFISAVFLALAMKRWKV
jgi:N-acetylneuraminic acid mutarotase